MLLVRIFIKNNLKIFNGELKEIRDFFNILVLIALYFHRDKQALEDTVRKLQQQVDEMKAADANNYTRSQRNRDLVEQASFEKAQAENEIKRLREELERQHLRVREIQHEMAKRVSEERSSAERRYNYQVP